MGQRENRGLKDLVERLHLELEEAVRREHRWKQKASKTKGRPGDVGGVQKDRDRPNHPGQFDFSYALHHDSKTAQTSLWPPHIDDDMSTAPYHGHSMMAGHPMPGQGNNGYGNLNDYEVAPPSQMPPRSFHQSRREPSLASDDQQPMLNHAGLLSLSSISHAQDLTSPPAPADRLAGQDSARSDDSGMLPQRPDRLQVNKPDCVPALDLSRLHERLEAEDDEDDYNEADLLAAEAALVAGGHPGAPIDGAFHGDYDEGDFMEGSDGDHT